MRPSVNWDDPPPSGGSVWFKGFAALWVLVVGGVSAAILFGESTPSPAPETLDSSGNPAVTAVDPGDTSYTGYRGRVLGINGDGGPVYLDDFEGYFVWVDMEGPWCSASAYQAQAINVVRHRREDVVFLTLVTSDDEPFTAPTRSSAREWANQHGLPSDRVVAYESTVTVPHHILYSPQGHELMRLTETLSADRLQIVLDNAVASWRGAAGSELH